MALPKMACHFRQSHLSSTFLSWSFFRSPLRFLWNLRGPPSFRFQRNRKGGQKKNRRFFFSPSAVEIACDFRRQTRVLFFRLAFFFPLPLRGRGNKILPFFPIPGPLRFPWNLRGRPFLRFRRNRKERQDVFPSAPQGQRKKTRESEERPSPQIPLESEGTRSRKKRTNFPRLAFFSRGKQDRRSCFPREKNASRGKYRRGKEFSLIPSELEKTS